jgi:hypothetical protein
MEEVEFVEHIRKVDGVHFSAEKREGIRLSTPEEAEAT